MKLKMFSPIFALFPKRCVFCGKPIAPSHDYCGECENQVSRIEEPLCSVCGMGKKFCRCKSKGRFCSRLAAPFYYESVVRSGIHRFKFRNAFRSADYFAQQMANTARARYEDIAFDYVLCVPMTEKCSKRRGYNQSALLSQRVAESLGVQFRPELLIKTYETSSQHGLNYYMRKGNLSGVFDVSAPQEIAGKRILLIDDVATSGETLDECAKMLYLYDAADICGLTLAMTKGKK